MEYLVKLWKHQEEGVLRATTEPWNKDIGFGFLFPPGVGKTGTVINTLRHQFNDRKEILRTLIFTPPIVVKNFKREWGMHSKLDPRRVICLTGSAKQRISTFREYIADGLGKVFITNYESLTMGSRKEKRRIIPGDLWLAFHDWNPQAFVWDESHRLKNPQASRSKFAEMLTRTPPHKQRPLSYLLSGTPVLNSPLDIFQQWLIMDGGRTFGENFFGFRAEYFFDANAGMPAQRHFPNWKIKPGAAAKITELRQRSSMTVDKLEALPDLPPLIYKTLLVEMTPEQKKLYESMKRDFVAYLDDKACVATLAITKAQRLMQIASGYVKTQDGEETALENTPKMDALRDLLEELLPTGKVIIWAIWKNNYLQIKKVCEELRVEYAEVTGEISSKIKDENVERFNNDPKCTVLIGNPGAGGCGINLVIAPYSVVYSRGFSAEHEGQASERNYRGGSQIHERIIRYDLMCEGTIEELVKLKLAQKTDMSVSILKDLARDLRNQKQEG